MNEAETRAELIAPAFFSFPSSRVGMHTVVVSACGMGSHGGPWEPGTKLKQSLLQKALTLVPTLPRGNAYDGRVSVRYGFPRRTVGTRDG